MRKLLLFMLGIMLTCAQLRAQNKTITGRIIDDQGNPVSHASVTINGSSAGTSTDANGRFTIKAPAGTKTLIASSVGLTEQQVNVAAASDVVITMKTENKVMSEVVVVGYQTIQRKELTSAVSKVSGSEVANKPVTSFDQALTGKAAGVQIRAGSGLVGENVSIKIRGVSSLTSSTDPLIIIDGVPVVQGNVGQLYNPSNALQDINPNDIESIEILKDASSAAIYGSRASNGVILITTKKGKSGTTKVTYDTYGGYNEHARKMNLLNGGEYNTVINKMRSNAGLPAVAAYGDMNGDGQADVTNTDWQEEVFRKGGVQSHQLSLSGGSGRTTFYGSASYFDLKNYFISNGLKRGSARLNVTTAAANWLNIGINAQYSRGYQNGVGTGTGGYLSGIPYGPLTYYPNVPVKDANGNDYFGLGGNTLYQNTPQPLYVNTYNWDNIETRRFLGSAFAEAQIIKGLKIKSQYAVDYQTAFEELFWNPVLGDGYSTNGHTRNVYTDKIVWTFTNTLNYNKIIAGDHSINFLAGAEYNKYQAKWKYSYGNNLNDPQFKDLSAANYKVTGADGSAPEVNGLASYFAGLNYSFRQRYLLAGNIRSDAFSGYGKDNRWGNFPSVSAGWRASEEEFLKNNRTITDLKLRASYGITGNSNIGSYTSLRSFARTNYADLSAIVINNTGNPQLKWERTGQFDIGFDMALFKKLNITFDYYQKKTRDLVLATPVLATLGFTGNTLTQNIGKLKNTGLELTLNATPVSTKNFQWTSNFNISYGKNVVLTTNANGDDITGGNSVARPGEELSTFYLIRWAGVNSATGYGMFYNKDGIIKMYNSVNKTWTDEKGTTSVSGVSSSSDKVLLKGKTPYPKYIGGFSNNFMFKGFDVNVDLQYALDFYVYDGTLSGLMNETGTKNKSAEILTAWTKAGDKTNVPLLYWGDNVSTQTSSRWLEKGDYMRVRNIVLGYSIPKSLTGKIKFDRIRVYTQIQNAFTITGYKGTDPEANANAGTSASNIGAGVDNYRPYMARTISFGLSLGL